MKSLNTYLKKEVNWEIEGKIFTVRNVPYTISLSGEGNYFDLDVCVRLTMVRDLMCMGEIPSEVDYAVISEIEV